MVLSNLFAVVSALASAGATQPHTATLHAPGLKPDVAAQALSALDCARSHGVGAHAERLAIIDYTLPSTEPRLWVFELSNGHLVFSEHVAHGQGSGGNIADQFSNRAGSHQTSLGLFLTDDTYVGGNGYSLRMHGLNPGINDAAFERLIVMHGAAYVDPSRAHLQGRLGRSWGCPAVRKAVARPMIDSLKDGQFIYAHGPGTERLASCDAGTLVGTPPAGPAGAP